MELNYQSMKVAHQAREAVSEHGLLFLVVLRKFDERLLKPLSGFSGMSGEMRELATIISRDIYLHSPNVRWEDIIGLEDVLFELARYHAPSTIFLDELESVMGQRGSSMGGEHEGSRRMKTELLVQMDGLARSDDLVFVLAASNLPWELDHAMLRRLEKRILVSLPSSPARQAMISHWLPPLSCTGGVELRTVLDYEALAKEMEGYSGSDIRLACKEAAMRPVRKIFDALESHQDDDTDMPAIQLETVTTADFLNVIEHTKPSARNLMDRYTAWEREYQSV
uniref:Katanin p60 subunit A-like 2 n=1 Tax=Neolamprologus brichardi TaxID=32507 RepID=A0A3Q4GVC3_NEOBR